MSKRIETKTEVCTNYISHLLGVGKIGFDNDYSEIYKNSILEKHLLKLQNMKSLLIWGNGKMGKLTNLMVFFPNYLNLNNKEKMQEYFKSLIYGIETQNYSKFLHKYSNEISEMDNWFGFEIDSDLKKYLSEIKELRNIYLDNFQNFIDKVYSIEYKKIIHKVKLVNHEIAKYNFIEKWENLTKKEFKYPTYHIILSTAINNGPNANSLAYNKNWFYYDSNVSWLIQFICHEVGTHILIDLLKQRISNINPTSDIFNILYNGFEVFCNFFNNKILNDLGLQQDFKMNDYSDNRMFVIFENLYNKNNNLKMKHLFNQGIELFLEKNGI